MVDAIKRYATKGMSLNVSGIITKDLSGGVQLSLEGSGSVQLNLEGAGIDVTVPIAVTGGSEAYNKYSANLNISSVSEGLYTLRAVAPGGGGEDSIPVVIDRTAPVINYLTISPSYNQYVPVNFSVSGTVSESGSGLKSAVVNGVSADVRGDHFSVSLNYTGFGSGANITISAQAEDYAGNKSAIGNKECGSG